MANKNEAISAVESRFTFIYSTIRERICLLEYAPGKRLSEVVLAEEFAVSRTPIRRVLGKLESEGLVVICHGSGNFVTDIKPEDLLEVYRFRMELVPMIGQLSPKPVTEHWFQQAYALQQQCLHIKDKDQPKTEFARINMAFFELITELVGNRPLQKTLEQLFYRSARMWPYLMDESTVVDESTTFNQEIGELIRLLEAGGIASVGYLRRCHIEMAVQRLIEMGPELGAH